MGKLWHRMEHYFGWSAGHVVTKWHTDGHLWVGFQCSNCGRVSGAHRSHV